MMNLKVFLFLLLIPFNSHANLVKFPLYKTGIKIDKPENYFLLTPENVNELKRNILGIIEVCESSKVSLEKAILNPNYQVLWNENNYNEFISFVKFPHFNVNRNTTQSLKEKLKEQCYSFKNISIEYISENIGSSSIGNYVALLYKVTTPKLSYYSEGFFLEGNNSTILISVNTIKISSNIALINSIEYINNEAYENIISEFSELYDKHDFSNALNKLLEAIALEPSNVTAYQKRIALNIAQKKYNEVLDDANIILNYDKHNLNALLLKGLAYYFLKRYNEAIEYFEQAEFEFSILYLANLQNEYYYSFADVYRLKGEAFSNLNNPEKAIENYKTALKFSYDSLNTASIYFNLGYVKSTLESDFTEAIKFYTLAINNYPTNAIKEKSEALYNRGVNYRKNEQPHEAINDYTLAIEMRPDYIKAFNNRAVAKLIVGDYKGVIGDCNWVIRYDNGKTENTAIAYYNRGLAKISLEDIKGCDDIKIAKSFGQSVSEEVLNLCK